MNYLEESTVSPANQTWQALPAIAMVGLFYAATLFLITWGISVWFLLASDRIVGPIAFFVPGLAITVLVGLLYAALAGCLALALVTTFNWTLGNPWRPQTAAAIAGGMAGFFATVLIVAGAMLSSPSAWIAVLLALLGPLTTMALGQLAAVYRVRGFQYSIALSRLRADEVSRSNLAIEMDLMENPKSKPPVVAEPNESIHPLDRDYDSDEVPEPDPMRTTIQTALRKNQITVRNALILTAWVALFLAVSSLMGAGLSALLCGYAVLQAIGYWIGRLFLPLMNRRLERKTIEAFFDGVRTFQRYHSKAVFERPGSSA